ncbi:hypothetical protein HPB47_020393, partial [Ixodes persulcatus]
MSVLPDGSYMDVTEKFRPNQNAIRSSPGNREFRIDSGVKTSDASVHYYWSLPAEFLGNQACEVNSYGGHLKYTFRYRASSRPAQVADVILKGNRLTLYHTLRQSYGPLRDNAVEVQFWEGEWHKADRQSRGPDTATREDIMMVLQNIEGIFVRASFDDELAESRTVPRATSDVAPGPTSENARRECFPATAMATPHHVTNSMAVACSLQRPKERKEPNEPLQEVLRFSSSTEGVHLTNLERTVTIDRGLKLDPRSKELVYQDFSTHPRQTYYWQLPQRFLGDKGNKIILIYRHPDRLKTRVPQTVSIPMFETSWIRADGLPATREHFLMVLADLSSILIKATLSEEADTASLVEASLDVAVEYPTGQALAHAVEHCRCPIGYKGLSCEDCDAGYTRSGAGLYLGLCVPCFCNGHSSDCDPETGACKNCQHNTQGEYCEECLPGFIGDATGGTPSDCEAVLVPSCRCDNRGSTRQECDARDNCPCKTNVQGKNCNRCKDGHFNLEASNPDGCSRCFCFGVTEQCSSSSYYRNEIKMQLQDLRDPYAHNFQLSNRYHSDIITDTIVVNPTNNEVSYSSFPRDSAEQTPRLWSLPEQFLGNKLTSYGGVLRYTQQYTAEPDGETYSDADVQITGNGVTIFYVNIPPLPPSETRTFEIVLRE